MNEQTPMPRREKRLATRLGLLIVLTVLAASSAVGYLAFARASEALADARAASLEAVAQAKEGIVIEVLRLQAEQASGFARNTEIKALFARASVPVDAASSANLAEAARARLVDLQLETSFTWIGVTDENGHVLASTGGTGDSNGLRLTHDGVPASAQWSAMRRSEDGGGEYRLVVPIRERGRGVGTIVADVRADRIWAALGDRTGLGRTGESYLMAADGTFLSPARGDADAAMRTRQRGALEFVRRSGRSAYGEWSGYRGTPSLGFVMFDDLRDLGVTEWTIVCEIDRDEAFAPVEELRREVIVVTGLVALVALVLGMFAARHFTRPIGRLVEAATRIGAGDLRTEPEVDDRDDEIGALSHSFVAMHAGLRTALSAMKDGISVLSQHASDVNVSARKYTSASGAQSAAVASTSVSLAETRRGSAKTAEAARAVLDATEAAAAAGRRGLEALDAGVDAMGAIEERVRGIANEALELSQQSARIGQIVATVNDLSEQSNVLAVNASVEAAKAGERGKGFGVVAQEVRRLAEQSKRATTQIRRILGDVQRAIESVVMAAEDGTKRTEDGRRAIVVIRATVDELAATLGENAESAKRIASSATEQATGIAQLASALETMERSGEQTSREIGSLERSAATLEGLGRELATVALRYEL